MSKITPETVNSKSVLHLKKLAQKRKKETGCKSSEAHEFVAHTLGFKNWNNVLRFAKLNDERLLSSFYKEPDMSSSPFAENKLVSPSIKKILSNASVLVGIHHQFATTVEHTLSHALQRKTEVNLQNVAILDYETFQERSSQFVPLNAYNVFHLEQSNSFGCLILEPPFIFQLLQLFFGGSDQLKTPPKRDYSEIEARMVKRVVMSMYEDLMAAWQPISPIHIEYLWWGPAPDAWLSSIKPHEPVQAVDFEFKIQNIPQNFAMTLCYYAQSKEERMPYFLKWEHPQTIALILTYGMHTTDAITCIGHLQDAIQAEVLHKMATLGDLPKGIIEEIREVIAEDYSMETHSDSLNEPTGPERAIEILKSMPPTTREQILEFWQIEHQSEGDFIENWRVKLQTD